MGVLLDLVMLLVEFKGWIVYDLFYDIVLKIWKGCFKGQEQKWFFYCFYGMDDQINIEVDYQEFFEWCWLLVD